MTKRIAWAVTGAGCWLPESFAVLGKLLQVKDLKIDLFFSEAGREVAQCYGVFKSPVPLKTSYIDKVREIPNFNEEIFESDFVEKYQWLGIKEKAKLDLKLLEQKNQVKDSEEAIDYDEAFHDVIFELDEGSSFPTAASASSGRYDIIVISPATGNNVAKISQGIADELIPNLAVMGNKNPETPIVVVPTDLKEGLVKSYLPIMLHSETCKKCSECSAVWACKPGAIRRKRGKIRINRLKCIGCLDCVKYCRYSVITFLEEIDVTVRKREAEAAEKLTNQEGFVVLETPEEAYKFVCTKLKLKCS
ncbi:MAG: flavoprotein [Candidatus Heimdallarchaeota archaeon]